MKKLIIVVAFITSLFGKGTGERLFAKTGYINIFANPVTAVQTNNVTVKYQPGFNVTGDRVLLIQMKGATIDTSNSSAFGTILNYNNAGNYEFLNIASITGNTVTFTTNITRTYDVSGAVQLIDVPQFTDWVMTDDTLTCLPWNGETGGVLVFEACGTVTLKGNIDVSSLGFLGASNVVNGSGCSVSGKTNYFYPLTSSSGAKKGEGITIPAITYEGGRGAIANGGGGGNDHNSGGGGGGNYAQGGHGGYQAWDCTNGNPLVDIGGRGGIKLAYSNASNKIFMGGGGGSGHANDLQATGSTNGGGIVIIKANTIMGNNKSILANGNDNLTVAGKDGAGGAGAGGTVLLDVKNFCSLNVSVNGGRGGNQDASKQGGNPHGPGGGGGGGVIWISSPFSGFNASYSGGGEGLATDKNGNKIPFGAVSGNNGGILTGLVLPGSKPTNKCNLDTGFLSVTKDTSLCRGSSVVLTAAGATSYTWSPATGLNTTTGKTIIANPSVTTTYLVSGLNGCKSDSAKVTVTVKSVFKDTINADICTGKSYFAGGKEQTVSGTYIDSLKTKTGCDSIIVTWLTTKSSYVLNRDITICAGESYFAGGKEQTVSGTYIDSLLTTGKCDSIIVTRLTVSPPLVINRDITICAGESYFAGGKEQTVSGTYIDNFFITGKCDTVVFTELSVQLPYISLGNDTIICEGEEIVLHAGNFTKYLWQDGTSNSLYQTNKTGIYFVEVTDSAGCKARDTVQINICPSTLWIPNVFTPNKDGKNDVFKVEYLNITRFEAYIFNRWGEQIYRWNDVEGWWDGRYKGKQCAEGVYVYIIKAQGRDKTKYEKAGFLTLIR